MQLFVCSYKGVNKICAPSERESRMLEIELSKRNCFNADSMFSIPFPALKRN